QDNIGPLRVLEKCGFTRIGEGRGFSDARGEEVEEFLLRLDEELKAAVPILLQCMKHSLAQERKTSSAVALSFDQFQLGHLPFDHAVVERKAETRSHRLFVFLNPGSEGLQFCKATLRHLSQPRS